MFSNTVAQVSDAVLPSNFYAGTTDLGLISLPTTYTAAGFEIDLSSLDVNTTGVTLVLEESFDAGQTWLGNRIPADLTSDLTKPLAGYLACPANRLNYQIRGSLEVVGATLMTSATAKVY